MILPGLDLDGLFNEAGGGKDISEAVSWQWEINVVPPDAWDKETAESCR